jgi:hypothetical protein
MRAKLETQEASKGLKVRVRCGSCQFLTGKCPKLEAPCAKLGKTAASQSCKLYEPDYSKGRNQASLIADVGKLVKDLPEHVVHLLAVSLIRSTNMARVTGIVLGENIKLGQPMMVNLSAPRVDYLNCWFTAKAMSISNDKKSLILGVKLFESENWATLTLPIGSGMDTIMTISQFKAHRKALVKAKKINTPDKSLASLMPFIPDDQVDAYEPPPISEAKILMPGTTKSKKSSKGDKVGKHTFKVDVNADGSKVVTI